MLTAALAAACFSNTSFLFASLLLGSKGGNSALRRGTASCLNAEDREKHGEMQARVFPALFSACQHEHMGEEEQGRGLELAHTWLDGS